MEDIFVTGIDTEVGKTVVSALLVELFHCGYWKPVQCGDLDTPDKARVLEIVSEHKPVIHPEAYAFKNPVSPHIAAKMENQEIQISRIKRPDTSERLIIEGAGGVLVPLNQHQFMVDLIAKFRCLTVVVSKNYLGCINHTLLTLEFLKKRKLPVLGIVFNGEENLDIQNLITRSFEIPRLLHLNHEKEFNARVVARYVDELKRNLENVGEI